MKMKILFNHLVARTKDLMKITVFLNNNAVSDILLDIIV